MITPNPNDLTLEQVAEEIAIKLRAGKNGFFPFKGIILEALKQVALAHEQIGMERAVTELMCMKAAAPFETHEGIRMQADEMGCWLHQQEAIDVIRAAAGRLEGGK